MTKPTTIALAVPEIRAASFRTNALGETSGVAYDGTNDVEFDVRKDGTLWLVNDDRGRNFTSLSLRRALRRAIRAQEGAA